MCDAHRRLDPTVTPEYLYKVSRSKKDKVIFLNIEKKLYITKLNIGVFGLTYIVGYNCHIDL